ncbi:MAG TPA: hypothetical protein PKJ43_05420 [Prolixibacteraceae bacterium]|nr:hypothetical protein [Prolixibacteraceae bacterium]
MKRIFSLLLMLTCFSSLAQKLDIRNSEFSFSIGTVEYNIEKFPNSIDMDFLNYSNAYPGYFDYAVVNFGHKFDFLSKMSADINLIVMSNLVPDNYDVSVYYHFNKVVALGLGSRLNKFNISYFEQFHLQGFPDYYLVDGNQRQFRVYDLGFYLTPMFKLIRHERFQTTVKFDIGMSSFSEEEAVFYLKRKLSNERMAYHYYTTFSFQPYVNPKLELRLRIFNINDTVVGLLLKSNFFYRYRSMNYNRSIQQWTCENEVYEFIRTPKHKCGRLEANAGLYVKW